MDNIFQAKLYGAFFAPNSNSDPSTSGESRDGLDGPLPYANKGMSEFQHLNRS